MSQKKNRHGPAKKKYKLLLYETFKAAKEDSQNITSVSGQCDQLNVCIREEGNMDDPELSALGSQVKVFAGQAWTTVHERRSEDGWYDELQE